MGRSDPLPPVAILGTGRSRARYRNRNCRTPCDNQNDLVEKTMKIEGKCHCGAIAYEAIVDPQKAGLCHCTDCQTLSGAPFRASVPALAADFCILRGEPKLYIMTAASGTRRAQAFCADCGTPIYAAAADNPTQFNLRLGAIVQRAQIPALKQGWCSSALAWAQNITHLPESPQR